MLTLSDRSLCGHGKICTIIVKKSKFSLKKPKVCKAAGVQVGCMFGVRLLSLFLLIISRALQSA